MRCGRVVLLGLVSTAPSCILALRVQRSMAEEVVRESLGPTVALAAERRQEQVDFLVRSAERVRVTTFAVETVERRRVGWHDSPQGRSELMAFATLELLLFAPFLDLCLAVADPFREDWDVEGGLAGSLLAVLVPGVTGLAPTPYELGEVVDTARNRRETGSQVHVEVSDAVTATPRGLRFVTDLEVFDVQPGSNGVASIPLDRLFGPARTPGRVTIAHGEDIFRLQFDGSAVTCTPVPR